MRAMSLPEFSPLRTARLTLRPLREQDLADLLEVNGDPEVTRFLPYAPWRSLDDASAWLQRMHTIEAGGAARQLVIEDTDGRVAGTVLLFRHDATHARLEVGYVLGRRHWHRGLMHEALAALCAHAFGAMGVRRLEAEVRVGNDASMRLLERLGFAREGLLRGRWVAQGEPYDTWMFGCLAQDRQRAGDDDAPAADGSRVTAASPP